LLPVLGILAQGRLAGKKASKQTKEYDGLHQRCLSVQSLILPQSSPREPVESRMLPPEIILDSACPLRDASD